ncbi:MAG TPA: HEAT repeat domain-containing protein [Longimicrobiales bacterium]|nr:HEAT repeat domain-containing protein [Longimicrobiales bacterium]
MTLPPDGTVNPALAMGAAGSSRADDDPSPAIPPNEVADLFAALEKAVRSQRLYQPNNPVYRGFISAAQSAVARLWNRVSIFTAGVEENAFRCHGRTFAVGEGRDSVPFLFYKDGVRLVTFLPGFETEVERFLDVINRARANDQHGDDMVTLLWQQEFVSFQYSYVDALAEGLQVPQSTLPTLAGLELMLTEELAPPPPGPRPDKPVPAAVAAGEPPVAGLVNRSDFEETLYFLDTSELARLRAEVELEWQRDVKTDVLDALFDRLEEGLPQWRPEILRILRQMLPVFLGAGDLRSATRVLVELRTLMEAGSLDEEYRQEVEQLFRELSEPAVLTQLFRSLEEGSIDPSGEDLGVFLQHLGPGAMPVLLAAIERTDLVALQERLRSAIEGLATAHSDRLVELLRDTDLNVLRGATRLIGQLARPDAAAAVAGLLAHTDAPLRRAAVDALMRIRNEAALEGVMRALTDDDREVRLAAARGMASVRHAPARQRLQLLLDSRIVREADLTEKIAFFEAFGSVATAESVLMLDRMLNGRKLLGREAPEMRACAAMALGRVGSPAARAALQRAANDGNAIVRNAVMKALRQESE